MGLKYKNSDKILEVFYENPALSFTVRDLTKRTKIPKSTVHKYLVKLKKTGLVTEENKASYSQLFKIKKINFYVEKIIESGLINFLEEAFKPSCIILFGSFRKGESDKESDIDIFVESFNKKEIQLREFEKKLKHSIQLFVNEDLDELPENLKINIINGIKLQGFLKLK